MKESKILLFVAVGALVLFSLWRNYGVGPKGSIILDSTFGTDKDKSNEQKELILKILDKYNSSNKPKESDILITSFGKYNYKDGVWRKYAEIWD